MFSFHLTRLRVCRSLSSPGPRVPRPVWPPALVAIERRLDPDLPAYAGLLERLIHFRLEKRASLAKMLGFFGGLALLVASLGVFGVTAHEVSRSARERSESGCRSARRRAESSGSLCGRE